MMTRRPLHERGTEAGNAIAMVFMAIGMAGVVTYGLNTIMRGPAVTAAETGKRTIVENNLIATTRLAIAASSKQAANGGDCDQDGFVEPIPFRDAGAAPKPVNGGLLPMSLGASMTDAWGAQYGYCVWDPGTVRKSHAFAGCGGAGANRLEGAPRDDQPAIAVISAGKNGVFETTCNNYVDTTPADEKPDVPLVVESGGSDDIVLSYTYAEANGIGGGLWKIKPGSAPNEVAEIGKNIRSTSSGGAAFGTAADTDDAVKLTNKGIVLPGDDGTNSTTGPCDSLAKDGQLRRNTSSSPPTVEMCDFTNGAGWITVSGGSVATPSLFDPNKGNCTANQGGPFVEKTRTTLSGARGVWSSAGRPVQRLFLGGTAGGRLFASTFDGTTYTQTWAAALTEQVIAVAGDGNYIYTVSASTGRAAKAWSWDGTQLTQLATVSPATDGTDVYAVNGKVYITRGTGGISAYTFNGTALAADGNIAATTSATKVWSDGTTVFVGDTGGGRALAHSGGALTAAGTTGTSGQTSVTGDAAYVYFATANEIRAYTHSGTTFTLKGTYTGTNIAGDDIWSDGSVIYAYDGGKVTALTFDGTTFTVAGTITLSGGTAGTAGNIWGDGNFIYVADNAGYIYTLSGFACESPNPQGGFSSAPSVVSTPTTSMPDSLDTGLVARWKMDEAASSTTITDSIGTNNGTLLGNSTRTKGQVGGGIAISTYDSTGGITIPGQLGQPANGTFAGWVNIANERESVIFSIGDFLMLIQTDGYLKMLHWDVSTYRETKSNRTITNDGWHYIAATWSNDTDLFRVYVDGVMTGEATYTAAIAWGGTPNTTFIGKKGPLGVENMTGTVDDFRVYNRPLSPPEIAELSKRAFAEAAVTGPAATMSNADVANGKISAGAHFGCSVDQDGGAWCWGRDDAEQLGDGTGLTQQNIPVKVVEPATQLFYPSVTVSPVNHSGNIAVLAKPWLEAGAQAFNTFAPYTTWTGYYMVSPGYPGVMSGKKYYKQTIDLGMAQPCYNVSFFVARLNASGAIQTELQLGPTVTMTTSRAEFSGTLDLGAFSATERIGLRAFFTNTCGSTTPATTINGLFEGPRNSYPSWSSISGGAYYTCGVKTDATGWCWGIDNRGQAGNSAVTNTPSSVPMQITGATNATWKMIDAGMFHACGIGLNGGLYCWGEDLEGQLGNGATTGQQDAPFRVGTDSDWAQVSASSLGYHTCAIKNNGRMYCWGKDNLGQLGNGSASSASQTSPVEISDPGPWVRVTTGPEHTCGVKTDGTAWCWGDNSYKVVDATGTTRHDPVLVAGEGSWVDVSAGYYNSCGLKTDGRVFCWGFGVNGDLGSGTTPQWIYPPKAVVGLDNVASLAGGMHNNCAIKTSGAVFCWGANTEGQLGIGTTSATETTPRQVRGMPGAPNWWNYPAATQIIMAPYGFNTALNGGFLHNANGTESFGFTTPGRAVIRPMTGTSGEQLLISSTATGYSAQTTFNATAPATTTDVTTGLVGRWPLDTNSNASVGASVNGTDNNGVLYDTRGKIGGTAVYSGVNSYSDVPRSAAVMEHTQTVTISFWMKRVGTQLNDANIITKAYNNGGSAPWYSWQFVMRGGNKVGFMTGHVTDTQDQLLSASGIPSDGWVHVVGVYNATGGAPQKKLFLNGVLSASATVSTNIKYDTNATTGKLYFASGCPYCAAVSYKGALDDVRIYNRALSDAEVAQLYSYQAMQSQIPYSMGIDHGTNNFEIGRNVAGGGNMLSAITPDIGVTATANVGVGTAAPATKLDVAGGMRLGFEPICTSTRAGTMRYTGEIPPYEYCDGVSWKSFGIGNMANFWRKTTKSITVGYNHSCGIKSNGTAWCWGNAGAGSPLGDNQSTTDRLVPVRVHDSSSASGWTDWVMISADQNTASGEKTCGIRSEGSLWCWGTSSALGQNNTTQTSLRPVLVNESGSPTYWFDWIDVSVGGGQACGIRANGTAWCWGAGTNGELGNNASSWQGRPVRVTDSAGSGYWSDWIKISAGYTHTCGIRTNGTAWCWGAAANGRLGDNQNSTNRARPVQVLNNAGGAGWSDWTEISAGQDFTCGVRTNGTGWCWGYGQTGKLGINATPASQIVPSQVRDSAGTGYWTNWKYIATGAAHACGVRNDGTAWCWGESGQNQLGDNQLTTDRLLPVRVHDNLTSTGWSDWVSIQVANTHSCGVRTNGTMWCWGEIWGGKIGVNRNNTPHAVRPELVQ